jgi:hypothetical protein
MNKTFVVGCKNCDFQRTVVGLDDALGVYDEHRAPEDGSHVAEVWSRSYLAGLGEEAPEYMPTVDTTDNQPSPEPASAAGSNVDAVDTDD